MGSLKSSLWYAPLWPGPSFLCSHILSGLPSGLRVGSGWWWVIQFSSVQSLSRVQRFATPWTAARQASPSITNSRSLLKFMSIESVMPSNHLILCRPLLLPPSIFPSIRVFSNESVLRIRWPMHWGFSFSIGPSNEYSGLISFRIDWLDLLAVQGVENAGDDQHLQGALLSFKVNLKGKEAVSKGLHPLLHCPHFCRILLNLDWVGFLLMHQAFSSFHFHH